MTRVIGGTAGGRRLAVPPGARTRPTSERVREALFSRLEHLGVLPGARVLDLYAGSGALGLEAMSRGAASAVLVERSARVAAVARRNAAQVGVGAAVTVLAAPVAKVLAGGPVAGPVDLVFLDPPYEVGQDDLAAALESLTSAGWAAPEAVVVVERAARSPEPRWPAALVRRDARTYGQTRVWFAEKATQERDSSN